MSIETAFKKICNDVKFSDEYFVSWCKKEPFYGGPEEGGWWGSDTILVAYQKFDTKEQADVVLEKVKNYAKELTKEAKLAFSKKCSDEMDWLEARGLESDYLPEVDGEEDYFVVSEKVLGSKKYTGTRHYE